MMCVDTNPVRDRLPIFYPTGNYNLTETAHIHTFSKGTHAESYSISDFYNMIERPACIKSSQHCHYDSQMDHVGEYSTQGRVL